MHQNDLRWCIFRVCRQSKSNGCWFLPSMMWFLKILCLEASSHKIKLKTIITQNGTYVRQSPHLDLILPLHYVFEPYASTFLSKIKKNHHNSKSTCHTKFAHSACIIAYKMTCMCRFSSLFVHFFPCTNWHFFIFTVSGGVKQTAKNFTFCWFWLGKMHWNGLTGMCLGFEVCQIQWHGFRVSMISGFLKNQNFRQKCHTLLILTGKNASNWLEWCVFRVWGMPNPMVQVSSLYNKEFLKNPNFRIQVA